MTGTDDDIIEVPWQWFWVPAPGEDLAAEARWLTATAAVFDRWLAERRQALPTAEETGGEQANDDDDAGSGAGTTGSLLAQDLYGRAGELPAGGRLVWGVGFDADGPRWWPVQVVVERLGNVVGNPDYLLDLVGARTLIDGVAPNVTYLSTAFGDGLRVVRAERGPADRVNVLIRAAIRIEWPATADGPAMSSDFLLTTRIWDMSLAALAGSGVDLLMRQMADAGAPAPPDGTPDNRPTELVEN
ncbi:MULTISPECIES: hypothetical protein [unclassified Frankia]|uniref:hypothetical protein n=1 Tax=unclassified Frankia TaxID=2632575 RepID=UPI001EF6DC72|nr:MULTISPECIES: hypothetical protein [unclassified Frankia]